MELKRAVVRARIDKDLKDKAKVVLDDIGLTESLAIRLLFINIVKNGKLPFELESKK